ncbi:hypothetical protein ACFL4D_00125 [Candidatus Margulisiibacteriota bacterium]
MSKGNTKEEQEEKKSVQPGSIEDIESDPVLGFGDWEVEPVDSDEDAKADHINRTQDFSEKTLNEFDGFDAYDSE